MIKKTLIYTDYDGNKQTETFWFHISKDELAEMEFSKEGGLFEHLQEIAKSKQVGQLLPHIKFIIGKAVGDRPEGSKRFVKNDDIRDDFMQSPAYEALFMNLIENADNMTSFVNGMVPPDLAKKISEALVNGEEGSESQDDKTLESYTEKELLEMPQDELDKLVKSKPMAELPATVMKAAWARKVG